MAENDERVELEALIETLPATARVAKAVLDTWPEHARYMRRSLAPRAPEVLTTTETLAEAVLALADDRLAEIAQHYRWTCARLHEEELYFHRNGHYRLRTFAEAEAEVYSDTAYMAKYMDGLLLSQVLWFNHATACHFFLTETPNLLTPGTRYLEIGPGHGLMMMLALRDFGVGGATAWDVSPVSIAQTRAALETLGVGGRVAYEVRDMTALPAAEERFGLVVLSEVLEHLEDPVAALVGIRPLVAEDGVLFVNVPINSPSPDHLYLLETPDDARGLVEGAGFRIAAEGFFATQGMVLERALRNRVSVSACLLARPG